MPNLIDIYIYIYIYQSTMLLLSDFISTVLGIKQKCNAIEEWETERERESNGRSVFCDIIRVQYFLPLLFVHKANQEKDRNESQ